MTALFLEMTLRGSLTVLAVVALDALCYRRMQTDWRRLWWLLVPAAFCIPLRLPLLPAIHAAASPATSALESVAPLYTLVTQPLPSQFAPASPSFLFPSLFTIWWIGAALYGLFFIVQAFVVSRRWAHQRLCTDSDLLNLLEDCKQRAGVTAPIGLIVSDQVGTPSLLGWFRPRILLPQSLVESLPRAQLQAILYHELAHLRWADIPFNSFFLLARILHWFNPLAHLAARGWSRFREEAADETALRWLEPETDHTYSDALLGTLKLCHATTPSPNGVLALGESLSTLKRRITMIHQHHQKAPRPLLAVVITLLLSFGIVAHFAHAATTDPEEMKKEAVAVMEPWLNLCDTGKYTESWDGASESFKKAVTRDAWVSALKSTRAPLGTVRERKLSSSMLQINPVRGKPVKGTFVTAQFRTSFINLTSALETVTFEKEADGVWRVAGYFVRPD